MVTITLPNLFASLLLFCFCFVTFTHGQNVSDIPACALSCFVEAVEKTTCSISDTYCQCTSGRAVIQSSVMSCLCNSTCISTELFQIEQGTLKICRAALSSSSQTYSAPTITSIECQGVSATHAATTTDTGRTSATSNFAAVLPTVAPVLQGAMLGLAGLAAAYAW